MQQLMSESDDGRFTINVLRRSKSQEEGQGIWWFHPHLMHTRSPLDSFCLSWNRQVTGAGLASVLSLAAAAAVRDLGFLVCVEGTCLIPSPPGFQFAFSLSSTNVDEIQSNDCDQLFLNKLESHQAMNVHGPPWLCLSCC